MTTVSRGLFRWLYWRCATFENFADRLSHIWTFGLLLLLASIISWNHNYNKPISCWVPNEFTEGMQQYADKTCWHKQFVYLHPDVEVPLYAQTKLSTTKLLHLWLPVILCFQALLFKLPNLLINILHGFSGISFDKIAGLTSGFENLNMQERNILSKQTSRYIYNWRKQFASCLPTISYGALVDCQSPTLHQHHCTNKSCRHFPDIKGSTDWKFNIIWYIKKMVELADDPNVTVIRPHDLDQFCNFIGEDGTMALKLIGANSSELFVGDVVCSMWMLRNRRHNPQQALQPSSPEVLGIPHGAKVV
ncbi:innexin-17-like [Mercenaria mercenaria]|uniref:innexin-17-like n=1 Tax=Mercenaria mercenaria TaxID=6596 RepID=UPI00234ED9E8|nr:innexin-17-like [Mercenaria mercenaria]